MLIYSYLIYNIPIYKEYTLYSKGISMQTNIYDTIYEKLQEPVKIYLNKETKLLLENDYTNFNIVNKNHFYNLLITNYIELYLKHLEETGKKVLSIMDEDIIGGNKEMFPVISRKIAYKTQTIEDYKERGDFISLRISSNNVSTISEMIASTTNDIKVSVFFRNLFLDYLSLPAYKREQIIFKEQYDKITNALSNNFKISYRNKDRKKSHVFSIHSIELSKLEFHNYLVGSFDNKPGAASIKLTSIETVRIINEKTAFPDNFDECYAAMKDNGVQFGISELKYWKVYITDEGYTRYTQRYLDRPKIHSQGKDEKGTWYIFNCSKFQLDGYFNPFGNKIILETVNIHNF